MNIVTRQLTSLFTACICLFLFLAAMAHGNEQAGDGRPVITSAAESDYPPFSLQDSAGRADGFAVELLRCALAAMGREVSFRTGSWQEVRGWLEQGEVMALPLVGRTPEREALFDFTFPYMSLHGAIVVRQDTTGIGTLDDLQGKEVAVMRGDNAEEFLRREHHNLHIVTTASFDQALQQLSVGMHDAVVVQRLVGLRLIQEHGLTNLKIINTPIEGFRQDFSFAVHEGDRDTLALLNEGLALVMADGTYQHLHAKWFARYELPKRALVIGGDQNYPPYEYLDDKGEPAGHNVDLTRAIARALGLDIVIRLGPWTEVRAALERGEIDALQGMFYSPERDLKFDFTPAHSVNHYVAVSRSDKRPPPKTWDELHSLKVAVQNGDLIHEHIEEKGLAEHLVTTANMGDALRLVMEGQADVALVSRLTALHFRERHGWRELDIGREALFSPDYCYAVRPHNAALLAHLGEGLRLVKENGDYQRIKERWMGVHDRSTAWLILKYVAMVAGPLLVVLALASLWSWSLRRQVTQRTRELLQSTEYQRALVACSPVALFSIDMDGKVLTWNSSAERLFGWREEEVLGTPLPIVPDRLRGESAHMRHSVHDGQILSGVEVVRRKKDGTLFDARLWLAPIRGDSGLIVGVMEAMEDITEQQRIEKEVEESEKRFRRAVEEAPFPIMMHAEGGQIIAISRGWLELSGYERAAVGTIAAWCELAYGEHAAQMRDIIERTYELSEAEAEGHFTITCHDGRERIWDFSSTPLGTLPDGRRLVISMAADITELLLAQNNILHLNHVLRAIRDINQLIIHEHDETQLIERSCAVLTESRGYRSALLVLFDKGGHPLAWAQSGNERCTTQLDELLRGGETPPCCQSAAREEAVAIIAAEAALCDGCFLPKHTECLRKSMLCARLQHQGSVFGHLVATQDVHITLDEEERELFTELAQDLSYSLHMLRQRQEYSASERQRKSLEEQLVQAQKMESVGRLAGGVAHDYNNMLSVIIGNAEFMLDTLPPQAPGHEELKEIIDAANRSADITRQLLAFARKQTVSPQLLDLNETVERSLKMLRRLIGEHLELVWRPSSSTAMINIDPVQIDQMLTNLCVNSRDAIADTGTITIETDICTFDESYCASRAECVPGEYVMLALSDTGIGMTRDQMNKVFEPFFTTKPLGQGTGLGLSTVYGIVKQNNGFISLYSEPGEGTTFKIYFPLVESGAEMDQAEEPSRAALQANGETILVVEDDPAILRLAGKLLNDLGYRPLLAGEVEKALELATETERLQLLLTDVIMPRMNGAELANTVQALHPDIIVVFMSGYTADVIAHKGVLNDDVIYIQKPFSKTSLAVTLKKALTEAEGP